MKGRAHIPKQIVIWSRYDGYKDTDSKEQVLKGLLKFMDHEDCSDQIKPIIDEFTSDSIMMKSHNNNRALVGYALGYLDRKNLLRINMDAEGA